MPLLPGDKLGQFDVLSLLGKGGMGEVYRARDTQLKRDVALKVLPTVFSSDPDRLGRFQREAELLASLDHSNIGHIYGIVQSDQSWALVLALVEGPTLDDRIKQGPLPADEAIAISKQIIDALEYAHEHGVIHRDLKPSNIKVTPDGIVKVLDFGLAKALDQRAATSFDPENSPTLTIGATQAGVIMGTAAYMSPEQAVGKAADRRSDIFSFGVVLFEMLTGKRPFRGESTGETLAAVVKDAPDWTALPAGTPTYLRKLLERMLAKDRKQRLQAIGEARIALENAEPEYHRTGVRRSGQAWMAVAGVAIAGLATLGFLHFRETSPESQLLRATILPPEKTQFDFFSNQGPVAISPNGQMLVFTATDETGKTQLWVRSLDSTTAQPLAGTEDAQLPFWSPDSRSIGFVAGGKLKRIAATGGPALSLANASQARGASWSSQGVILYAPTGSGPLEKIPEAGGATSAVTKLEGNWAHKAPWFLPDGKHFLYLVQKESGAGDISIHLGSLDGEPDQFLLKAESRAIYSRGYLLFLRERTLMAQPFDAGKLVLSGDAIPVAEQVQTSVGGSFTGFFSASNQGLLVYQPGSSAGGQVLTWFDRTGKRIGVLDRPREFVDLSFSPDRAHVAAQILDTSNGSVDLWVYDVARQLPTRLTFDEANEHGPVWSPDGRTILFGSTRGGLQSLNRRMADGSGQEEMVYGDQRDVMLTDSSSPDGKIVLLERTASSGIRNLWALPLTGEPKPIPFMPSNADTRRAQFSPNGKWVAYVSGESGRPELYVARFPEQDGKRQISSEGGYQPRWRPDGKELYFVGADRKLMAAEISGIEYSLTVGRVVSLGIGPIDTTKQFMYDVSRDGQRFLVATEPERNSSQPLTLVQNWTALLLR